MAIVFEQKFEGSIWKAVAGAGAHIGIEERNEAFLEVAFYRISLKDYGIEKLDHPEFDWWLSLIGIDESTSYYKKFESEKDPFRQQLLILDQFNCLKPLLRAHIAEASRQFLMPAIYSVQDNHWHSVEKFLNRFDIQPVKSIEYAELPDFFAIVYHQLKGDHLERAIIIVSNSGKLLFESILDAETKGEASQGFITFSNLVIFVEERKKLRILEV